MWRCVQGSVDTQLRMQLRDDSRILAWEDFEPDYDALSPQLTGTLHLSAWAIRAHMVGREGNRCTVSLENVREGGLWHPASFILTDLDFKPKPYSHCLVIPLAESAKGMRPASYVLVVDRVRPGVYQRIGAHEWNDWWRRAPTEVRLTWHDFQLE